MKLNRVEWALMNNPARERPRWRYKAPLLERLGGRVGGAVLLPFFGDFVIGIGRPTPAADVLRMQPTAEVYA